MAPHKILHYIPKIFFFCLPCLPQDTKEPKIIYTVFPIPDELLPYHQNLTVHSPTTDVICTQQIGPKLWTRAELLQTMNGPSFPVLMVGSTIEVTFRMRLLLRR